MSDESTEQAAQQLETQSTPLDASYAAQALEEVHKAVKGNGIKADAVQLRNFTGETLVFNATTTLKIQTKLSEKTVTGRITGPQKVDSPQELRDIIEKHKQGAVTNSENVKRIRDFILARGDQGFGLINTLINLDFLKKEFVHYDACSSCRAEGMLQCQRCHGNGYEICPRCNGQGLDVCPTCQGNGQIQNHEGKYQSCHRCRGERKVTCSLCQQKRKIQCGVCKTKGSTTCKQCNGQGWNSFISIVEMEALTAFDYDRRAMPKKINAQIETLAGALSQYIRVSPVPPGEEIPQSDIILSYQITLPYGETTIALSEKKVSLSLFGIEGKILNAENFVEDLIEPGAVKLEAAASGRGPVESLVKDAAKYRTIRSAIIAAGKFNKAKAVKVVLHNTPLGLSAQTAQQLVTNADAALKNLTRRSRQTGMILGLSAATIICTVYFLSSLRGMLAAQIPNANLHFVLDGLALALSLGLGYALSEYWKNKAKKTSLKKLMGKKN